MTTKTKTPKMTELEQRLLTAVWFSEYHDGKYPVDNAVWTNCATETLGKSAQGAITSAKKKGWVVSQGDTTEDRVIWVTAAGAKALAERMPSVEFQVQKHKERNARDVAAAVGPAPVLADPKMESLRRMVAEGPRAEGEPARKAKPRLNEEQAQAVKEALQKLLGVAAALQELTVGSELDEDTASDFESDTKAAARQLEWLANQLYQE